MNRKIMAVVFYALSFAVCGAVHAQQAGKIFRIGFLDGGTASGLAGLVSAFRQELSKHGWVEGKNITIDYRFGEGKNESIMSLGVAGHV